MVGGVGDRQVAVGVQAVGEQVVEHAAVLAAQHAVLRAAAVELDGDLRDVVGQQPLQQLERLRAGDFDLAHVRDVEHAARLAHGAVLGADARRTARASPSRRSRPSSRRPPRGASYSGVRRRVVATARRLAASAAAGANSSCRRARRRERASCPAVSCGRATAHPVDLSECGCAPRVSAAPQQRRCVAGPAAFKPATPLRAVALDDRAAARAIRRSSVGRARVIVRRALLTACGLDASRRDLTSMLGEHPVSASMPPARRRSSVELLRHEGHDPSRPHPAARSRLA